MSQQLLENPKQPIFKYSNFLEWMHDLANGTDPYKIGYSAHYMSFMKLNLARMKRLDRIELLNVELLNSLSELLTVQSSEWMVLTEPWCGDSAQSLPVIHKLAEALNIPLTIVLRDRNPNLIERYHTNGSHSIPKLVALDAGKNDIFVWGPRPAGAQKINSEMQQNPNVSKNEIETTLHTWYARDKSKSIQNEIIQLVQDRYPVNHNYSSMSFK